MENLHEQASYEVIPINAATRVRFYTSVDPGSYVPPHWHDALELVYLLSGALSFTVAGHTRKLAPGELMLVNPNVLHATQCSEPNTAIVFQIPVTLLEELIPDLHQTVFLLENHGLPPEVYQENLARLKATLREMQAVNDARPKWERLRFTALLYAALVQLLEGFSIHGKPAAQVGSSEQRARLAEILEYTSKHYNEPIPLREISAVVSLQPTYFCRFFKAQMGMTYLEYQNELRLSYILRDLLSTDDSIASLLERHGFTNYKVFSRLFRERFHAAPSEVRARFQREKTQERGRKGE